MALLAIALAAFSLRSATPASALTACEAIKPTIQDMRLAEANSAGATLEAQIDPENSATTYEFVIVQQLRNPEDPLQHGEPAPQNLRASGGPLPAGAGGMMVRALITGLQPGYTYWYEVAASNLAGETLSGGDNRFSYLYTGGFPNGLPGAPYSAPPPSACELEFAQQEAERIAQRAEAERQARQVEETVLRSRSREMAAPDALARSTPSCVVPALTGDTLSVARRAIRNAHCRLGEVRDPHRRRGTLLVVEQSRRRGTRLAGGASISLTVRPVGSRHRRTR